MPHVTSVFCLSAGLALACSLGAQRILATTFGTVSSESLGSMIATLGDLDGDGVPDYVLGTGLTSPPTIHLCSGRTTGVLRTLTGPLNEDWGTSVADIGDVNADGVRDLAVGAPLRRSSPGTGAIDLYSGRDGSPIATILELEAAVTYLGRRVLGIDDVDADGVPDFVATAPRGGKIRVVSGRTRASHRVISFGTETAGKTTSLALLGDVNGDGVREIVAGDSTFTNGAGRIAIIDPRTGAILRTVVGSTAGTDLGTLVAGAGDVDGDGGPDFAATAPRDPGAFGSRSSGAVFVYSGRSGNLLRTLVGPIHASAFGKSLASLGDVNGDGVPDFAVGSSWSEVNNPDVGALWFSSGLTGGTLMLRAGFDDAGGFAAVCAAISDFDGDGIRDVLVSAPQETDLIYSQGAVRILSGRILAEAALEGTGCGGGPFVPLLGGTRPVVGTTALLVGEWPPGVPGFLLLSPPPPRPTNLGVPACNAYVDIASATVLLPIAPGINRWTVPLPVPSLPGFAGLEFEFQVLYGPTSGPLGFDLTNGLRWRIGW